MCYVCTIFRDSLFLFSTFDRLKVPGILHHHFTCSRVKMNHLFPPVSPFSELVQQVERTPNTIILRDHSSGMTATAGQLLYRVSLLRAELREILVESGLYKDQNENKDRFIYLLAPPGLEYIVSMLTIFSLGVGMSAQCKS